MSIEDKIKEYRMELWDADYLYRKGSPIMTDLDFDLNLQELAKLEKQYPEFDDPNSPTKRIGIESHDEGFATCKHFAPMLSIGNTYSYDDLKAFLNKRRSQINKDIEWFIDLKIDGCAVDLWYKDGCLVQALTRGDGDCGDDITDNVRTVRDIPLYIENMEGDFRIRGELYMTNSALSEYNKNATKVFQNPRNAVSGSIKLKDSRECAKRPIRFFAHTFVYCDEYEVESQSQFYSLCKSLSIPTAPYSKVVDNVEVLDYAVNLCESNKITELDFETDGIVIKANKVDDREIMGMSSISPNWAIALKVQKWEEVTTLKSVTWQVSYHGLLTPVAELEPVRIAGTTVSRATLHNIDNIRNKQVMEGDLVRVQKSGKIIPNIVCSLTIHGDDFLLQLPDRCPCCGELLELVGE
jgi:DNA ligase (NAD+)